MHSTVFGRLADLGIAAKDIQTANLQLSPLYAKREKPRGRPKIIGYEVTNQVRVIVRDLAKLIEGTAGCSPFLTGLMAKEADWLFVAFQDPEGAFSGELGRLKDVEPGALAVELRRTKRRVALLTALADLATAEGMWFHVDTPFGGYRQSGLGRENGLMGFEEHLETKVMGLPVRG